MSDLDRFREFIANMKWTFAKSMPTLPHEYIVRWNIPAHDEMFTEFAQYIRDHGYKQNFYSREITYLDIDGHKYWTMGSPIHNSISIARQAGENTTFILNRAKINDHSVRTS